MDYRLLWAKSDSPGTSWYHPLWCHLLDVAAVCEKLLPRFGGVYPLPTEWLLYLVALHDIGKADAEFQNKDAAQAARLRAEGFDLPACTRRFAVFVSFGVFGRSGGEVLVESLAIGQGETAQTDEGSGPRCQAFVGNHGSRLHQQQQFCCYATTLFSLTKMQSASPQMNSCCG